MLLAALIAAYKTTIPNSRQARVNDRTNIKCTYYGKTRHLEHEYYIKHPKKKAVFDKIITKKKALKKQQALLKAILSIFVAITATTTIATATPPLPPSTLYKFSNRARMFIATLLLLLLVYIFNKGIYANIAEIEST